METSENSEKSSSANYRSNRSKNNLITYDPERKAEIFASILQDRFTPNPTKTYVRTNFDFVQLPDTLPPSYILFLKGLFDLFNKLGDIRNRSV